MSQEYVDRYLPIAQKVEQETGIPALVQLAQSALETGWGASTPGNMFFGIKAKYPYTGKRQLLKTKEIHPTANVQYPAVHSVTKMESGKYLYVVSDYFRAYDSPINSFRDYAYLIKGSERYREALKYKDDPVMFAKAIAQAGYATDPDYFNKIKKLIDIIKKKAGLSLE